MICLIVRCGHLEQARIRDRRVIVFGRLREGDEKVPNSGDLFWRHRRIVKPVATRASVGTEVVYSPATGRIAQVRRPEHPGR